MKLDEDRSIARLANTLDLADRGQVTIVFTGQRAEIAADQLTTGATLQASGAWDHGRETFTVDRFDIDDAAGPHSYSLTGDVAAEPAALDTSPLLGPGQVSAPAPQGHDPLTDAPPLGSAQPSPRGRRADRADHDAHSLDPGQRVVALDRGNKGTVVAVGRDLVEVRFRNPQGAEATRSFRPSELEPIDSPSNETPSPPPPAATSSQPPVDVTPAAEPGPRRDNRASSERRPAATQPALIRRLLPTHIRMSNPDGSLTL
jgi:hypothetical protein